MLTSYISETLAPLVNLTFPPFKEEPNCAFTEDIGPLKFKERKPTSTKVNCCTILEVITVSKVDINVGASDSIEIILYLLNPKTCLSVSCCFFSIK